MVSLHLQTPRNPKRLMFNTVKSSDRSRALIFDKTTFTLIFSNQKCANHVGKKVNLQTRHSFIIMQRVFEKRSE